MTQKEIEPGHIVAFQHEDGEAQGTVRSVGPKRVHIQSGQRGVYVDPDDVLRIVRTPKDNELPLFGENFRFSDGIEQ
jgi:hypothetical protein